jgi:hypothetical protein
VLLVPIALVGTAAYTIGPGRPVNVLLLPIALVGTAGYTIDLEGR